MMVPRCLDVGMDREIAALRDCCIIPAQVGW